MRPLRLAMPCWWVLNRTKQLSMAATQRVPCCAHTWRLGQTVEMCSVTIAFRWYQCNRCNLQYIGETKRRLKDRFNEHRRTIHNPDAKSEPTTAAKHFLSSPNHTANFPDMQLTLSKNLFQPRLHSKGQGGFFNSKRQNSYSRWSEHPPRNHLIYL